MAKYVCVTDCGNSPKREFIKVFNSYFASEDIEKALACLTEDVVWEMVGSIKAIGKEEVRQLFSAEAARGLEVLTVDGVISHGREGCAYGSMTQRGETYSFCDVYVFNSVAGTSIRSVKSFLIKTG